MSDTLPPAWREAAAHASTLDIDNEVFINYCDSNEKLGTGLFAEYPVTVYVFHSIPRGCAMTPDGIHCYRIDLTS